MAPEVMVRLSNVHKRYGDLKVLDAVDLTVMRSEKLVIIGASGSGKTTLLRCVIGLETIDEGTIAIEEELFQAGRKKKSTSGTEKNMRRLNGKVGMVFQQFNLFPHMTVLENVTEAPVWVKKIPQKEADAKAR